MLYRVLNSKHNIEILKNPSFKDTNGVPEIRVLIRQQFTLTASHWEAWLLSASVYLGS